MKRPYFAAAFALLVTHAFSQSLDLAALNGAFAPTVTFRTDKQHRLIMDFHENGVRFRQDIVFPADLDPASIAYSPEEDGIALKCRQDRAQCISKEIFKLDVVRITSRVTVPRPVQDPSGEHGVALFKALVDPPRTDRAEAETPRDGQRNRARKEP